MCFHYSSTAGHDYFIFLKNIKCNSFNQGQNAVCILQVLKRFGTEVQVHVYIIFGCFKLNIIKLFLLMCWFARLQFLFLFLNRFPFMGQPVPGAQTSEGQNHMQQAITQVMQLDMGWKQNCSIMITKIWVF